MAKKAKIFETIGEGFEDVVYILVKNDKKYMKQDIPVKKENKTKKVKGTKSKKKR